MYVHPYCTGIILYLLSNYFYTTMADKNVDYAHVDECSHVNEDVDNLLGEQSTHVSGEQSTSKTLSQLEAHMAKMAETMSRMGDMWGRIATKRDCVDSSTLPFPPKRNRLDDDGF